MVRLLAVSNDSTIAQPVENVQGDTHQRQLHYASILESYHFLTKAPDGREGSPIQLADNFWVYPGKGGNMASFAASAVPTGIRIAREQRVQAVSCQDPFVTGLIGYRIARRLNLPLSLQFHADMIDNPYWLREKALYLLLNRLAHWLIRRADTFRVVSTSEKEKLQRLGIPEDRIWMLASIVGFSRFTQADDAALRQQLLGDRFKQLLLFVGRLAPQKDLPMMVDAFAAIAQAQPTARLVMAGDGPLEEELRHLVRDRNLGDAVHLAGAVPYADVPAYYAAADIFVLSSVYEGNARVLAEAAASARPAVSTDVSGAQDTIVDGDTGFIVPVGDVDGFAARVVDLLSDGTKASRMGVAAREHILSIYDTRRLLNGFENLWETTAAIKK